MRTGVKPLIRNQARVGIIRLQPPGDALLFALPHKSNHFIFRQRRNAEENVIDRDAVSPVTDHILEAEVVHQIHRHRLRPARSNGKEVPGVLQLFNG